MHNNLRQNKLDYKSTEKRSFSRMIGALLYVSFALTFSSAAVAESEEDLQRLQANIEKETRIKEIFEMQARALQQEARNLRNQLIEAASRTQDQEYLIDNLNERLAELKDDVAYRKNRLDERSAQLSGTLGALTKLSDDSASAFFLFPGTPRQSVHSAMLLKSAVPALRDRAFVLKEELDSLAAVETDIHEQLASLETAGVRLQEEQASLKVLLSRKKQLAQKQAARQAASQKRIDKLVREAKSMQDLLDKLNKIRPSTRPENTEQATASIPSDIMMAKPTSVRAFPNSGRLPYPVSGKVVQRYGQDLGFGQTAKGIKIKTRAAAQAIAPHDGQIAFAGPFRDHGLIVIIEHEGGYHTILSGLDVANVVTGQWVLSGEPIGSMSQSRENGLELYVELRRNGKPLNPLRWFKRG